MQLTKIIPVFFAFQNNLKLYHWTTTSFARHKASDDLSASMNDLIDRFVETSIAKVGRPTKLPNDASKIMLKTTSDAEAPEMLASMVSYLTNDLPKQMHPKNDVDLLAIRDDMVEQLNKTLYLFTLE